MDLGQQNAKYCNDKSGQLTQKLLSSLGSQTELMIDFTSLKSCLNQRGHCEENQEGEDVSDQFDYNTFVCDLLENQSETLPNLKKLTVRHILDLNKSTTLSIDQQDQYMRINYGIMQLSSLSELDLSHIPHNFHGNLQLWNLYNLTKLSITNSQLTSFPSSVGSLRQLKALNLSVNQLGTLPVTLAFCQELETLNLQENAFLLLPSVLMHLKKLTTLKRHGNPLFPRYDWAGPRYIKKIKPISEANRLKRYQPLTLQESCAKQIFTMKIEYWETNNIGGPQCRTLDTLAEKFYTCDYCSKMVIKHLGSSKFEVNIMLITFKELSGVPFQLRACSEQCQDLLAESYGNKNIELQHELDIKYENDMKKAQEYLKEGHMEELPNRSYTYTPQMYYSTTWKGRRRNRKKRCSIM